MNLKLQCALEIKTEDSWNLEQVSKNANNKEVDDKVPTKIPY